MRKPADPGRAAASVARLSVLVACASVLQVAETLLPYPLPGIRLGLANMVTLIALVEATPADALRLALLRTLTSSFVLGTFLTPSFVLSFCGAMVSTGLMVLLYRFSERGWWLRFSLVGISVAGSVAHVLTQIAVVYLVFVRNRGVLLLWPLLALSGVVMGLVTGVVAIEVCRRLAAREPGPPARTRDLELPALPASEGQYVNRDSLIHRARPEAKITVVLVLALAAVLVKDLRLYCALFLLLVAATVVGRVPAGSLWYNFRRLATFLVFSFLAPLFFTPGGKLLFALGPLKMTSAGFIAAETFTARIIILFFATSLLALTTTPARTAAALENMLGPLKVLGISARQLSQTLTLSWSFFPALWQRAQEMVRDKGRRKLGWSGVMSFLPDLVTGLYVEAEKTIAGTADGAQTGASPV
jgi:uncharacterized membrane protein/energy-coupling factor transporter transmembrane protein EcfT